MKRRQASAGRRDRLDPAVGCWLPDSACCVVAAARADDTEGKDPKPAATAAKPAEAAAKAQS